MLAPNFSSMRALIFDLDGTLIDSKQDLIRSVNAMLVEMGREALHQDTISGYIGHGAPKLVARALGNGASEEERERALKFFLAHYEGHKLDSTRAYPGVAEALEQLHEFPMAVLTNKPVRVSNRILVGLGLAQYFRAVYGGNSFETKKPEDRKSTRLNSSHVEISYAVFCLKKKKKQIRKNHEPRQGKTAHAVASRESLNLARSPTRA